MLPSELPEVVADEEPLARFLTSSSQFSGAIVKAAAFLPYAKAQMTTSVFRHGAEPRETLIHLGRAARSDCTLHGAAICNAAAVRSATLDVVAHEPPPRHANIVGWPVNGDQALQKAAHKERALEIASSCRVILF